MGAGDIVQKNPGRTTQTWKGRSKPGWTSRASSWKRAKKLPRHGE